MYNLQMNKSICLFFELKIIKIKNSNMNVFFITFNILILCEIYSINTDKTISYIIIF